MEKYLERINQVILRKSFLFLDGRYILLNGEQYGEHIRAFDKVLFGRSYTPYPPLCGATALR
jgi:hypothetical protein